jgi:type I restriction enzyme M protein
VTLPAGVFSGAGAAVKTNLLFFTKGTKTSKIWYYDLTHLKIGKKSPMTLAHFGFGRNGQILKDNELPAGLSEVWLEDETNPGTLFPSYARLLSKRGTASAESPYSWTVDFGARRRQAREAMQPHLDRAERLKSEIVSFKEELKALRKTNANTDAIEALESKIKEQERAARESQSKADEIGAAVFDLKGVNPNVMVKLDTRTPAEVIQSIEDQGKVVAKSLETLRALL